MAQTMTRTPEKLRLKLYPQQLTFVQSEADTVTFQGGAGSGKTRAGCVKALLFARQHPGSRGMIVGASYPSLRQAILPHLETVAHELGLFAEWQYNRSDQQITLPNGASLWLRSADNPSSLLGADLAWLWGDEPALWKHDAYRYCTGRLRQPDFPHQAFFTFTPKGRGWAWEELGQPREGLEIVTATSLDNPFVGNDFFARLRREYGEGSQWWQQEVLGEFVAFEGLIYPHFSVERHVAQPPPLEEFVSFRGGCDWGWTNPGVFLLGGLHRDGALWILREWYETERTLDWWVGEISKQDAKTRLDSVDCDPSEPGNIDALAKASLPAQKANNAVIPGITAVSGKLGEGQLYFAPECTETIKELQGYCWKRGRDGDIKRDEPEKVRDHAADALRYLVAGLLEPSPTFLDPTWRKRYLAKDALA